MSRRTPIKELIAEDSVPGSPRRKSTRIAAKVTEDKEISTPAKNAGSRRTVLPQDGTESQKDDDEVSVSSTASSTTTRRITRAASKSPTSAEVAEIVSRRITRASSTSSLNDANNAAPSPVQTRRRSTRSMSTSPTADSQEVTGIGTPRKLRSLTTPPPGEPGKPRGRRPSISDKVIPMESIEENQNKSEDLNEEVSQSKESIENDDNLPFKKKKKAQNLITIEEKSFSEDPEGTTEVKVTNTKPLAKFSLSLNKKGENEELPEEKELLAVLSNTDPHNESAKIIECIEPRESNVSELPAETNTSVDSVFNSGEEAEAPTENLQLNDNNTPLLAKAVEPDAEPETVLVEVDKEMPEVDIQKENNTSALEVSTTTTETTTNTVTSTIETTASEIYATSKTDTDSSKSGATTSKSDAAISELDAATSKSDAIMIVSNAADEIVANKTAEPAIEDIQVIPESPAPKLNESRTRRKSDRRSLSDTEEYAKNSFTNNITKPLPFNLLNSETSQVDVSQNREKEIVNVSGSSDLSDKENLKIANVDSGNECQRSSKSFSEKSKAYSFCEPMEVEYASDIDRTVCVVATELTNSPKLRSSSLLKEVTKSNLLSSSTPKKSLSKRLTNDTNNKSLNTSGIEQTSPEIQKADENNSLIESNIIDVAVDDLDEYEENHPSIIHSSDEEAAEAERRTYTKSSTSFKTPDRTKHPLLSDETYNALVIPDNETDKSDDPDFEVSGFSMNSDNDKTFKSLHEKIDDLLSRHRQDSEESSSEESSSEESVTHFLDEYAEEGEEDTPSEGSNDIVERGESLGSSDSETGSGESDEDLDSFIDDDEQNNELLSGNEIDVEFQNKSPAKKRSRIISVSDSDNEVIVNGEVQQDDDLEKMSTRPYCGLSPPSVISIRESPTMEDKDNDVESIANVIINKEDNLQSLEKIKQVSPLITKNIPEPNSNAIDSVTPNNSLTEDTSKSNKRLSFIKIQHNISMEDIENGGIGERINKVFDAYCSSIKDSSSNVSGSFALNISLDCVKSPSKTRISTEQIDITDKRLSSSRTFEDELQMPENRLSSSKIERRSSSSLHKKVIAESPKFKLNKSNSSKVEPVEFVEPQLIISKIPVRLKEEIKSKKQNGNNLEFVVNVEDSRKKSKRKKSSKETAEIENYAELPEILVESETDLPKPKKKKKNKQKTEQIVHESDFSTKLSENKTQSNSCVLVESEKSPKHGKMLRKRKVRIMDEEVQPKKSKYSCDDVVTLKKPVSSRIIESQNTDWVVEKTRNIDYFPSSLLNVVANEHKLIDANKSKPTFVPSTSQDRKSWGYTQCKKLFPSTSNRITSIDYADTFPTKDFKNKMLFNPTRITREDMKTHLKKKEKAKF